MTGNHSAIFCRVCVGDTIGCIEIDKLCSKTAVNVLMLYKDCKLFDAALIAYNRESGLMKDRR